MTQLTRHNPDKLPVVWEARISTIPESADRDKRINPWAAVATKAWKPRHSGPAGPITIITIFITSCSNHRSATLLLLPQKYMRWHSPFNNPDGDSTHVPNAGGGTLPPPFHFLHSFSGRSHCSGCGLYYKTRR
ncbi:hypothetical protein BGY98DRAFT_548428 [Russula aff. rugulosa BPL654]|nr:hypothetical protein BGY98DRAFT_548428 [Russula aff. rugulosa BPL654]